MEAESILLKLHDESAGFAVSPQRVPLAVLRSFINDASAFLRGDDIGPELAGLEVALKSGSLALQTRPVADPGLWADLRLLADSDVIDGISPKRRALVESWQAQARSMRQARVEITAPSLRRPIVISKETDFHTDDADHWVRVERYVRGEIEDLGGAVTANAHMRLPDGKRLKVDTDRAVLRDDKTNRLYKPAMVRITAEYNVLTREYRKARLLEFVEHDTRVDERELDRLFQRGAKAWQDMPEASAWVDELRGNPR